MKKDKQNLSIEDLKVLSFNYHHNEKEYKKLYNRGKKIKLATILTNAISIVAGLTVGLFTTPVTALTIIIASMTALNCVNLPMLYVNNDKRKILFNTMYHKDNMTKSQFEHIMESGLINSIENEMLAEPKFVKLKETETTKKIEKTTIKETKKAETNEDLTTF